MDQTDHLVVFVRFLEGYKTIWSLLTPWLTPSMYSFFWFWFAPTCCVLNSWWWWNLSPTWQHVSSWFGVAVSQLCKWCRSPTILTSTPWWRNDTSNEWPATPDWLFFSERESQGISQVNCFTRQTRQTWCKWTIYRLPECGCCYAGCFLFPESFRIIYGVWWTRAA